MRLFSRRGIELEWEFPDVKYSSSHSAQPIAVASINTANHRTALPNTDQGTPPWTHTVKKGSEFELSWFTFMYLIYKIKCIQMFSKKKSDKTHFFVFLIILFYMIP